MDSVALGWRATKPEPLSGCGFDHAEVVAAEMGMLILETMTRAGGERQIVDSRNSVSGAVVYEPRPRHCVPVTAELRTAAR
jgi:hypothetical protein